MELAAGDRTRRRMECANLRERLKKTRELLSHVKMEHCSFKVAIEDLEKLIATIKANPAGTWGNDFTDFLREQTRLWRTSWIIPVVEEMIEDLEQQKEKRLKKGSP